MASAAETISSGHSNYPAFRSVFPDLAGEKRALRWFFTAAGRAGSMSGPLAAK